MSLAFILIGTAGIVLFYGPMNAAGDSCYCLIPSPEPGAAQGTSSIILAMGVLFFPMGLLKGGVPSFRRAPVMAPAATPLGRVPPIPMANGLMFGLGLVILIIGADAVMIPGYLILKSVTVTGAGATFTGLGAVMAYLGSRKPKPT